MAARSDPVDARADRVVQGAVTVVTLGAFVFHQNWVIPILAVLVGAGALLGPPGNPFHRLFSGLLAPHLPASPGEVAAATVQAQDALACGLLVVATFCLLIGLGGVAWVFTLLEGGVAAVAATTGVHLGVEMLDRLRRR